MKIIDLSFNKRCWGYNCSFNVKHDEEGYKWTIDLWLPFAPEKEDLLYIGLEPIRHVVYKVKSVESCGNPNDMYFVKAIFTPQRKIKNKEWFEFINNVVKKV